FGELGGGVGDQGDFAESGLYCEGRVQQVRYERTATRHRRVGVAGADAEVLCGRERRHLVVNRSAEEPVDILLVQTGVGESALCGLSDQIQWCEPGPDLPELRFRRPDYRALAPKAQLSSRTKTATG